MSVRTQVISKYKAMSNYLRHWIGRSAANYRYVGNCTMPNLQPMIDRPEIVGYNELLHAVGQPTLARHFPEFYWGTRAHRKRGDIALHQDPCVLFYKSTYSGVPCYFVQESGIEHIFVEDDAR